MEHEEIIIDVGQKYKGRFIEEAECPECHSYDHYECVDSGLEDNFYFYRCECQCGSIWTEFHRLTFDSIRIDQPVNKETDQ
jgi:hypothetical protein